MQSFWGVRGSKLGQEQGAQLEQLALCHPGAAQLQDHLLYKTQWRSDWLSGRISGAMAAPMLLTWATAALLCAAARGQDAGYSGFTTNFGGKPVFVLLTVPWHWQTVDSPDTVHTDSLG